MTFEEWYQIEWQLKVVLQSCWNIAIDSAVERICFDFDLPLADLRESVDSLMAHETGEI